MAMLQDGTPTTKTFDHVPSEIGAEEAEEVGVEHLLRLAASLLTLSYILDTGMISVLSNLHFVAHVRSMS